MEISGYEIPDESSCSEDSLNISLDVSSDSETFNSAIEQYPRFRELYKSLYRNTTNNSQRSFEHSPKSTQHTGECSKKMDSVIESQVEILQLLKLLKEILSEKNKQNENLVTMNNYWDTKWRQASGVYKNMHNTVMHMKDTNDTIESKLNAILMKLQGFIQDDLPKLKQNLDECVAKNIVIEETLHKCYNAVLNLNEVLSSEKSSDAVKTEEFARNVNDTNIRVKNMENQLMDIKKQLDNNSKLDNMKKALVTLSVQQHYLPRSCPTSPYLHYSCKTANTPLNSSFHHVNSQAFASVSLASSSKKSPVLQSGDKKRDLKKNILTTRSANHDHLVFTSNEQNAFMSEETAGSMQEKLKECSPRVQSIYNEQPDISYGEAISPAVTSASGAQRPATQQNQHHKGKKRDSKENSLNTPLESAISAKVSSPQLHVRLNAQMFKKNVKRNSPSISSTSGRKRPCYFRTKDSPKPIKTRRESVYDFDL